MCTSWSLASSTARCARRSRTPPSKSWRGTSPAPRRSSPAAAARPTRRARARSAESANRAGGAALPRRRPCNPRGCSGCSSACSTGCRVASARSPTGLRITAGAADSNRGVGSSAGTWWSAVKSATAAPGGSAARTTGRGLPGTRRPASPAWRRWCRCSGRASCARGGPGSPECGPHVPGSWAGARARAPLKRPRGLRSGRGHVLPRIGTNACRACTRRSGGGSWPSRQCGAPGAPRGATCTEWSTAWASPRTPGTPTTP